jgi:hypothetical protein
MIGVGTGLAISSEVGGGTLDPPIGAIGGTSGIGGGGGGGTLLSCGGRIGGVGFDDWAELLSIIS